MTPRTQALAFRLWAYASPRGWDCTAGEAADALDVSLNAVIAAIRFKGWAGRFRVTTSQGFGTVFQSGNLGEFDNGGLL